MPDFQPSKTITPPRHEVTCQACAAAEKSPRIDLWENGCTSCQGRALAIVGAHWDEKPWQILTLAYREKARSDVRERLEAGRGRGEAVGREIGKGAGMRNVIRHAGGIPRVSQAEGRRHGPQPHRKWART